MQQGIVTRPTPHSVDQAVARIEAFLQAHGIKLFAVVDHSGEAAAVGLDMPPTKLLIFGNPKGGTPLMLAAPSIALDLPLKILVTQDAQGQTQLSWNDPAYLQQRHNLPAGLTGNIAAAEVIASMLA